MFPLRILYGARQRGRPQFFFPTSHSLPKENLKSKMYTKVCRVIVHYIKYIKKKKYSFRSYNSELAVKACWSEFILMTLIVIQMEYIYFFETFS